MDTPAEEDALLTRALGGDERSLEALLLLHYDRLRRRIDRRFPDALRGVIAPEDILQQTLTAVCLELASFERRGRWAFYRWLCTIAEFRLRDALKAERAAKRGGGRRDARLDAEATPAGTERLIDVVAGDSPTPSRAVNRREAAGAIQVGLAGLPEDSRRAIQLRYVHGLPVNEVAEIMGRTPHAVHNLCHRGMKVLRGVMGRTSLYFTRR